MGCPRHARVCLFSGRRGRPIIDPVPRRALALLLAALIPSVPHASEESEGEDSSPEAEVESPRLDLALWGGQIWSSSGAGSRTAAYGAEATWRFDALDLGVFGGLYDLRETAADGTVDRFSAPVCLARIGQRFETRSGLLANFTFGVGAAKTTSWRSWFQVALGGRATYGPAFLAGELSFESDDLIRLSVGIGVSLL